MNHSEKVIEVLNDLIKINNDRIEGYEKAVNQVDPEEVTLKGIFYQMSEESHECRENLADKVRSLGGEPVDSTTNGGKIYQAWMNVQATFSGDDSESTLNACEVGEEAAQRAYQQAVEESIEFPNDVKQLILNQRDQLKLSQYLIKNQRDQYQTLPLDLE